MKKSFVLKTIATLIIIVGSLFNLYSSEGGIEVKLAQKNPTLNKSQLPAVTGNYLFATKKGNSLNKGKLSSYGELIRAGKNGFSWIISDISQGKYYLRLLVESGSITGEEELGKGMPFIYLNGKAVHFSRAGKLSQYKNIFVAVIESSKPLEIRNGDEIRWNKKRNSSFGSLALSKNKMVVAPIWLREFADPALNDFFSVKGQFNITTGENSGNITFSVQNLIGSRDKLSIQCKVLDYFQNELATFKQIVEFKNRQIVTKKITFPTGASDRYRAIVTITDSKGKSYEKIFSTLADDLNSVRKKIWLNNYWQWISIADDLTLKTRTIQPPESIKEITNWKKTNLPASWQDRFKNKKHHLAWYRKTFSVPKLFKNDRYFLHLARAGYEMKIYLNGNIIGHLRKCNGPFDFEITKYLQFDSPNHLLISLRGKIASLDQKELSKKHIELSPAAVIRAPIGMRVGLGEVSLYSTPNIKIEDVFVKTSFRKNRITTETTLPKSVLKSKYSLHQSIYLAEKKIYEIKTVALVNDTTIITSGKWTNPPLWGPEKYPLLRLETELRDSNGKLIDRLNTRFGFREFWVEGMALKWNGEIVKFGSRPFHNTWSLNLGVDNQRDNIRKIIRRGKRLECNMFRHIYNSENFASIADEEGMLIVQGGAHTVSHHTQQQLNSDEFWENTVEFAKVMIQGLRNAPSIVEWYLSNEYYGYSEAKNKKRLIAYGKEVLKLDDTRILEFGCDLDLAGDSNIISVHYPVDVSSFRMDDSFLPEAAYWRYFKDDFKPGMKIPAGMCKRVANVHGESQMTWGYKPIIINETCWISFFKQPDGLTRIFSDHVYESPWAVEYAHDLANTWFSHGHRDADVSAVTLWKHLSRNPNWISLPKIDINILQKYNKFYSEQKIIYDVNLIRDIFNQTELLFSWVLKNKAGKIIDSDSEKMIFKSCALKRVKIALTMPVVEKQTSYSLIVTLTEIAKAPNSNNNVKHCDSRTENGIVRSLEVPIKVYPREEISGSFFSSLFNQEKKKLLQSKINIGVFDKTGKTAEKLTHIFKEITRITSLDKATLAPLDLLIIGEEQPKGLLQNSSNIFSSFVNEGGRIVLLRQTTSPECLPLEMRISNRVSSINYTFRPNHPLLKNISEDELSYWYPNHKCGANYYVKPKSGNFKVIVESGGPEGMVYTGMVEILKGKGSFICSQLFMVDNYDTNPVIRKMWKNIISYSDTKSLPFSVTGYIGPGYGNFITALKKIRTQFNKIKDIDDIFQYKTIILEISENISKNDVKNIKKFVADGGTLIIHKLTPDNVKTVSEICEQPITVSRIKATAWQSRAIRLKYNPEMAGLTNFDFFWRNRPETEDYRLTFLSRKTIQDQLGKWQIKCNKGEELIYPSLLVKVKQGKGRVILNNLNWGATSKKVSDRAKRIASTLLTNMGVEVKGFKALQIPKNINYLPIDISQALNRSFTDEKNHDGKGGWTDQGPTCDLRSFPIDKPVITLLNVPFNIEKPKSCLVLNSKPRPGAPESVILPLDVKADVLFFLQSSAWTSAKHHASYIVKYADGTECEIRLIGGVNLRDWAVSSNSASSPFLHEIDTITKVAWSGATKKFGNANLYMMAWLNQLPEKKIKSITFKSMNVGIPVLVSITAGIKKEAIIRVKSTKDELAQALSLNVEGEKFLQNKKIDDAEKSFKKAIEIAWDYPISYLNLGYFYEQQTKWDKAIAVYEKLLNAVPIELEAYLRIGKCQEIKGEFKNALETYRRSLKADINQPDIMKALEEVKKKINE